MSIMQECQKNLNLNIKKATFEEIKKAAHKQGRKPGNLARWILEKWVEENKHIRKWIILKWKESNTAMSDSIQALKIQIIGGFNNGYKWDHTK